MITVEGKRFREFGFTHYYVHPGTARTTLFVMDLCEHCGEKIQAANAIGGHIMDEDFYIQGGMVRVMTLPEEGYHSDEVEGEACYNCNA